MWEGIRSFPWARWFAKQFRQDDQEDLAKDCTGCVWHTVWNQLKQGFHITSGNQVGIWQKVGQFAC